MKGASDALLQVNLLFSFIASALAVIVPLYLLSMRIDISTIGFVLSLTPLVFMVLRILLASIADDTGTPPIFLAGAGATLFSILSYAISPTVPGALFGRLGEGAGTAAFWAVNRTDGIDPEKKEDSGSYLANLSGMRGIADGFGRLAGGLLITITSFFNSFMALGALTIALSLLTLKLKNGRSGSTDPRSVYERIMRKRPIQFWKGSVAYALLSLPYTMLVAFLIPVFAYDGIGLDYVRIGIIIALFALLSGLVSIILLRSGHGRVTASALMSFSIIAMIAFPYLPSFHLFLVALMGMGAGAAWYLLEFSLADLVSKKGLSTDIGVVFIPLRLGEFLFFALGGLAISAWGYPSIFTLCAALSLISLLIWTRHKSLAL